MEPRTLARIDESLNTLEDYFATLQPERKAAFLKLHKVIEKNLPKGFAQGIYYGMIGFVVPHSLYAPGYHVNPKLPLQFMAIANQKNCVAVHHMGIYASPELSLWFTTEFAKRSKLKLDMGKGCIRFKKPDEIPFDLIGELASKISPKEWIALYEKELKRSKK